MAYLYGNRHNETYTYKRVAWDNWQEHESYNYITKGSVEYASDAELKVTGQFDFEGYDTPDVNDLIRIYYSFTDDHGEYFNESIATLFGSYSELTFVETTKGIKANGKLNGESVLSVLNNKVIGQPHTIKRDSNAVYEAEKLITECHLNVYAEPSAFNLSADHTFEAGTSYLEMVNWLLASASFADAFPNAMGTVQLKSIESTMGLQYVESYISLFPKYNLYPETDLYPYNNRVVSNGIKFVNDSESIMYPELVEKNDWQNTPNVVRLLYNVDDACIVAEAKNLSGSRASLGSRGNREITYFSEVSDVGQGSKAESLRALAESVLREKSCDIEYVTWEHAYVPMEIYTPVKINYGDLEWIGNVDNINIDLSTATKTQSRIMRSLYQDILIQSSAVVLRG